MKILVLNASPKKKTSITLQSALFLEKTFPSHTFSYKHIGVGRTLNEKNLEETLDALEKSNLVIFSFPVYTFLAPSQLHYFIRILKERNLTFPDKNATLITTSKHFYDMTAHKYLEENLLDLGFNYIEGLSLDMEDLLKKDGQENLISFFKRTLKAVDARVFKRGEARIKREKLPPLEKENIPIIKKKDDYTVSIVVDYTYNKEKLESMINYFCSLFPYKTRLVDLSSFSFKGGCLGCLQCALSGKCVYNDGFERFLEDEILSSDGVIYAFSIIDHSMGPLFKNYDDRRFYNGHRTVSQYKPVGYIIDGNLKEEENLKTILEARSDTGRNYLTGLSQEEEGIKNLVWNMSYALENKYVKPRTFYGVGGMKIFRDLIWMMRGIMKDDHIFYKKNNFYDFPQKERGKMLSLYLVGSLMRNKKFMKKNKSVMDEGMLAPYKKTIEKAESVE